MIAARGALADIREIAQDRNPAQNRVVMRGLMDVAPAKRFQRCAPGFGDPNKRVVQCQTRDVAAGFLDGGSDHVAPCTGAVDVAVDAFDEKWLHPYELGRQWAEIIADQPFLQGPQPSRVDQRLRQVFVHFAVPVGQQIERTLAQTLWCAFWGGFSGEPKISANERQQRASGDRHGVELCFDKAVARVHLAALHQTLPAHHTLAVPPIKTDMQREGAVDGLVIGVADDATGWVEEDWVRVIGEHTLPAVFGAPSQRWHSTLTLVRRVAPGHGSD